MQWAWEFYSRNNAKYSLDVVRRWVKHPTVSLSSFHVSYLLDCEKWSEHNDLPSILFPTSNFIYTTIKKKGIFIKKRRHVTSLSDQHSIQSFLHLSKFLGTPQNRNTLQTILFHTNYDGKVARLKWIKFDVRLPLRKKCADDWSYQLPERNKAINCCDVRLLRQTCVNAWVQKPTTNS